MEETQAQSTFDEDIEVVEGEVVVDDVEVDPDLSLSDEEKFAYKIIKRATSLKGVTIHRDVFLRTELIKKCPEEMVNAAVATTPQEAGVPADVIDELADAAISIETRKVSGLSALAGIPGGLAMIGTIPADLVQYFAHSLRIEQKLAYLYGWSTFLNDEDEVDDETMYQLILFLGVMMQVGGINVTLTNFAAQTAKVGVAKAIQKQALTKTLWYNPMKKILSVIGVKVTKSSFAEVVSKAVPVVGGVVSGGLTYATFKPGSVKLKRYLRTLPQATGIELTEEEMQANFDRIDEESKNEYVEAAKVAAEVAGEKAAVYAEAAKEKAGAVAEVAGERAAVYADVAKEKAGAAASVAASGLRSGFGGLAAKFGKARGQEESAQSTPAQVTPSVSSVEAELRSLKGLLDDGIITQEDFDAKKKDLLGL